MIEPVRCTSCGNSFTPYHHRQIYCRNDECQAERRRVYARDRYHSLRKGTTAEERRDAYLRKNFRITLDDFNRMLAEQDGHCKLCPNTEELKVDHDHSCCPTRKHTCGECIRGILCNSCNLRIHVLELEFDWIEAAVEYLTERAA